MYSPVTHGESFMLTGPLRYDGGQPLGNLAQISGINFVFAPAPNQPSSLARFEATGTANVTDTTNGTYQFTPSSGDIANLAVGQWRFQAIVVYPGGIQRFSDPQDLTVRPAL